MGSVTLTGVPNNSLDDDSNELSDDHDDIDGSDNDDFIEVLDDDYTITMTITMTTGIPMAWTMITMNRTMTTELSIVLTIP